MRRAVRTQESFRFAKAAPVPNSRHPVILYRDAFEAHASASVYEATFARNGWSPAWRNGVYPFLHLHSTAHEVLGIVQGRAILRLGGKPGCDVATSAGDVLVLPAGTGHRRISSAGGFLVVGAYPEGGTADLLEAGTLSAEDIAAAEQRIEALPVPPRDPVTGEPMAALWAAD